MPARSGHRPQHRDARFARFATAALALALVGPPGAAFTPSRQEACCQSVMQGSPDPALCGAAPPTRDACAATIEAMSRAAAAQRGGSPDASTAAAPPAVAAREGTGSLLPSLARWLAYGVAFGLAALALRWIGARRLLRYGVTLSVFAVATLGAASAIWWGACAWLRCIDTMGLGILVVATLPATAIGAWIARRVSRRLAASGS